MFLDLLDDQYTLNIIDYVCTLFYLLMLIKSLFMYLLSKNKRYSALFNTHVLGILNKEEMLVLVWIRKIASAKIGANDRRMILSIFSYPYLAGIEFVTIT